VLAGLACFTTGLGVLVAAVFAAAYISDADSFDTPDLPLYVAGAVLTALTCVVGALSTWASFGYAAGRGVTGQRAALLFAATWLLWFAWGVPTSYGLLSGVLVVYTVALLPVAGLVLLVAWLLRRRHAS
jgi:hypothetical protein